MTTPDKQRDALLQARSYLMHNRRRLGAVGFAIMLEKINAALGEPPDATGDEA